MPIRPIPVKLADTAVKSGKREIFHHGRRRWWLWTRLELGFESWDLE